MRVNIYINKTTLYTKHLIGLKPRQTIGNDIGCALCVLKRYVILLQSKCRAGQFGTFGCTLCQLLKRIMIYKDGNMGSEHDIPEAAQRPNYGVRFSFDCSPRTLSWGELLTCEGDGMLLTSSTTLAQLTTHRNSTSVCV